MATSFLKSMQQANTDTVAATSLMAEVDTEETFVRSDKYLWYEEYRDDNLSYVDDNKNITVNPLQFNLTQEKNSQYIPFEMSRYYDGIDLMDMSLLFRFVNKNKDEGFSVPINVSYSNTKIRFAWLVGDQETAVEGLLSFEIQATGVNEKGDEYKWLTRPNEKGLNVLKSLAGNGIIEPSTDWTSTFITQVNEKVALAQAAAQEASTSASNAENSAQLALQAASDSQVSIEEAKTELSASVESAVNEKVTASLVNYYTQQEVDDLIANVDITEQLTEVRNEITTLDEKIQGQISTIQTDIDDVKAQIDSLDGLANFNVEYDGTTMTFYNGETVMKEIPINSDPSLEWTTSYTVAIDQKIATAKSEALEELNTYKTTTDADLQSIHDEIDGLPETLESDYYTKTAVDELLGDLDYQLYEPSLDSSLGIDSYGVGIINSSYIYYSVSNYSVSMVPVVFSKGDKITIKPRGCNIIIIALTDKAVFSSGKDMSDIASWQSGTITDEFTFYAKDNEYYYINIFKAFGSLTVDDLPAISAEKSIIGNLDKDIGAIKEFVEVNNYGAKGDGITDDSDAIIAAVATGKNLKFKFGTYLLTKPVTLTKNQIIDFSNSTIVWGGAVSDNSSSREIGVFNIKGSTDTTKTAYADGIKIIEKNVFSEKYTGYRNVMQFHVNRIPFSVGDVVKVEIKTDTSYGIDTFNVYKNCITEIIGIDSENMLIWGDVSSEFNLSASTGALIKVDCIENVVVKNLNIKDNVTVSESYETDGSRETFVSGISLKYARNCHIQNVTGVNTKFPLVLMKYSNNCSVDGSVLRYPAIVNGGEGYNVQAIYCYYCDFQNIVSVQERHNVDISGGGYHTVTNCISNNSIHSSYDCHGMCEEHIIYKNCIGSFNCGNGPEFVCITGSVVFENHQGIIQTPYYISKLTARNSQLVFRNCNPICGIFENCNISYDNKVNTFAYKPNKRGQNIKTFAVFKYCVLNRNNKLIYDIYVDVLKIIGCRIKDTNTIRYYNCKVFYVDCEFEDYSRNIYQNSQLTIDNCDIAYDSGNTPRIFEGASSSMQMMNSRVTNDSESEYMYLWYVGDDCIIAVNNNKLSTGTAHLAVEGSQTMFRDNLILGDIIGLTYDDTNIKLN